MVIGVFLLIGLAVIVGAVIFAFTRFEEPETITETTPDTNFNAGFDKSALDDSNNYFEEMEKIKRREDKAEKARLAREKAKEDELRRQAETNKSDKPVTVVRVTDTPPRQPTPRVSPSSQSSNGTNRNTPPTPMQRKQNGV